MDQEEALRQLACKWADLHKYVFNMVTWTGEDAEVRQSATATILIQVEKDIYRNGLPKGPAPTPEFKTADKIGKAEEPKDAPESVPSDDAEMFGTDKYGHAWSTVVTCLNEVAPGKYCGERVRVRASARDTGNIYAICPKCKRFVQRDGKPGKAATGGG